MIDALDEAGSAPGLDAAHVLIAALIRPLATVPTVRLLIGARPQLVPALGSTTVVLDLDASPYLVVDDLAVYTERILLSEDDPASPSPYRGQHELARRVAQAVAHKAHPSFLVARTLARGLIHASPIDVSVPQWWMNLPSDAGAAFDSYLSLLGERMPQARKMLAVLAFAYGEGLPWEMWTGLSSAVFGQPCRDADLMWLLDVAGAFVVEATQDGRSVYRLYHEALAEHLRARHPAPAHVVHARIVKTLKDGVPLAPDQAEPDWKAAYPYVRRHLAVHAASARGLDPLLTDPRFVLAADLDTLLTVTQTASTDEGILAAFALERAAGHLRTVAQTQRAAYLQLAARKCGADTFAERLQDQTVDLPWSVLWARLTPSSPHRVIAHHQDWILSLALAEVDGVPVVVTRGEDDLLSWDLRHGTPINRLGPPSPHPSRAPVITAITRDGRPLAVAGYADGTLQRWDLRTSTPFGPRIQVFDGPVFALAAALLSNDTRIVLASGGSSRLTGLDLDTGLPLGTIQTEHKGYNDHLPPSERPATIAALTTLRLPDGRGLILTGGMDGTMQIYDLDDGRHLRIITCHTGRPESISALAAACVHDSPVVAVKFQSTNRRVDVWDIARSQRLYSIETDDWCTAIDVVRRSAPLLIIGVKGGDIIVHDLATGARSRPPLRGHDGSAYALASSCDDTGAITLVSAGDDRTARLWRLHNESERPDNYEPIGGAGCRVAAFSEPNGGVLVISPETAPLARRDRRQPYVPNTGKLLRWDLLSGRPIGPPIMNTPTRSGGLSVAVLADGRPIVFVCGVQEPPQAWEVTTGRQIGNLGLSTGHVETVRPYNGPATALVSHDRHLQAWDLDIGRALGPQIPLPDGHHLVTAAHHPTHGLVAVTSNAGGWFKEPLIVTVWQLNSGIQLGSVSCQNRTYSRVTATSTPDGRLLCVVVTPYTPIEADTTDEAMAVQVWDALAGEHLGTLDADNPFTVEASSLADGRVVAVVAEHDRWVKIYDLDGLTLIASVDLGATVLSTTVVSDHHMFIFITEAGPVAIQLGKSRWQSGGHR